ncbi:MULTISPECIES: cytochrome D1 domain-containing protein [unclassified Halomonas]|uniref:cytochrome D1 domain-containing protein n=1 Tax=unclassified Halomonas TaxID=2609666 RepID=UPI0028F3F227|nr:MULTISPECIES: cytochrome D1 domain-containing protein [unclassified Halomonas]
MTTTLSRFGHGSQRDASPVTASPAPTSPTALSPALSTAWRSCRAMLSLGLMLGLVPGLLLGSGFAMGQDRSEDTTTIRTTDSLGTSPSPAALPEDTGACQLRATGGLGVVVERADGRLALVDRRAHKVVDRIEGLGDLSHASVKFSSDERYAYVFGRDGGLTKVDLLCARIAARVIQSGNSIGGAISQDGRIVAVANYEPGGVKLFDSDSLTLLAEVPARYPSGGQHNGQHNSVQHNSGHEALSKVVGLVDAPGHRFVYSLWEADEIQILDTTPLASGEAPTVTRFTQIGDRPYDALIDPIGRYYVAGLFGEDHLARLDLWHPERGVEPVLSGYRQGDESLPVYKMPHLEGWTIANDHAWWPAVGRHEVLMASLDDWQLERRIAVHGQPVFVMSRPDQRQLWVNFAYPDNDMVQVLDSESGDVIRSLTPGQAVLHMEFSPRGEEVWISARDSDQVVVYDTATFERLATLDIASPSGIFFTDRAHRIGL